MTTELFQEVSASIRRVVRQGLLIWRCMTEARRRNADVRAARGDNRDFVPQRLWSRTTLQDVEREYILLTLRESSGVIAGAHGAAAKLGMKRTTLQSRMQKLGITREEYDASPRSP